MGASSELVLPAFVHAGQYQSIATQTRKESEDGSHVKADQSAGPQGLDSSGGRRPAADSGSSDRKPVDAVSPELLPDAEEGRKPAKGDQADGAQLRAGVASGRGAGLEPGSGPGVDSGLDYSLARSLRSLRAFGSRAIRTPSTSLRRGSNHASVHGGCKDTPNLHGRPYAAPRRGDAPSIEPVGDLLRSGATCRTNLLYHRQQIVV